MLVSMQTRPPPTLPNEPPSVAAPPALSLKFVFPREVAGLTVRLARGLVFGRDPSSGTSAVCVPHPTVSRRHANVQEAFGVPIVTDLGSSNGTLVDGVRIDKPTPVRVQSVVRFGDTIAIVDEEAVAAPADEDTRIPGVGPRMARVRQVVARSAPETGAVLVLGETGTGKEWLAADVHRLSGRTGPYLKLSCAELSPQLIESELFGHERGAFTGAVAKHAGLFLSADGGTLFLDEVGELPLDLQAKLLRVLQEGEVRPVGSVQTLKTDVRVVCATNRDLARLVEEDRFRRDLYARLSVFEVRLPALRERRQDILDWIDRFTARATSERGRPCNIQLQPAVAERILGHTWPENLRGIDRLVQRLLSISDQVTVGMSMLGEVMPELAAADSAPSGVSAPLSPKASEKAPPPVDDKSTAPPLPDPPTREEFLAVYEATGRSVRATSKHFGRDRRQVYRWLEAFGIER
jgi:transcriptional regulator with GAF, ATPase, and Fis domain